MSAPWNGSPHSSPTQSDIEFRELRSGIWVVRANGRHLGIIERGHRYAVTDSSDVITRGFPTFATALEALVASSSPDTASRIIPPSPGAIFGLSIASGSFGLILGLTAALAIH